MVYGFMKERMLKQHLPYCQDPETGIRFISLPLSVIERVIERLMDGCRVFVL